MRSGRCEKLQLHINGSEGWLADGVGQEGRLKTEKMILRMKELSETRKRTDVEIRRTTAKDVRCNQRKQIIHAPASNCLQMQILYTFHTFCYSISRSTIVSTKINLIPPDLK